MPSFDIVSEADAHEIKNALDQAQRELTNRYDFQGSDASIERNEAGFKLFANSEDRVKAVYDVLVDKFVKRKLSLKFLEARDPEPAGGQNFTLQAELKKGIDRENARALVQMIKDNKALKVTPAIQGDAVRVSGKKKDDLQGAIAMLRRLEDFPLHLSFENFRD